MAARTAEPIVRAGPSDDNVLTSVAPFTAASTKSQAVARWNCGFLRPSRGWSARWRFSVCSNIHRHMALDLDLVPTQAASPLVDVGAGSGVTYASLA